MSYIPPKIKYAGYVLIVIPRIYFLEKWETAANGQESVKKTQKSEWNFLVKNSR